MKKSNKLSILIFIIVFSPSVFSVTKNLCDDLANTDASEDQIKKCWDKFGKSDTAVEKEKSETLKKATEVKNEQIKAEKESNIEVKKFTESDLQDAGFGKDFYAIKYSNKFIINGKPKESKLTKGDSMCQYLGYEKAIKIELSPKIAGEDMYKKGLFVDTTFGIVSKEPELFSDNDAGISVRKFTEISCARRKDKNADPNNDTLKNLAEAVPVLNEVFTSSKQDKQVPVNNDPRSNTAKEGGTPYGYKKPDWATDTPTKSK